MQPVYDVHNVSNALEICCKIYIQEVAAAAQVAKSCCTYGKVSGSFPHLCRLQVAYKQQDAEPDAVTWVCHCTCKQPLQIAFGFGRMLICGVNHGAQSR